MRDSHAENSGHLDITAGAPCCPACRSQEVSTTSKVANAESYWRCGSCGEVWNVGRRREAIRQSQMRPYGR